MQTLRVRVAGAQKERAPLLDQRQKCMYAKGVHILAYGRRSRLYLQKAINSGGHCPRSSNFSSPPASYASAITGRSSRTTPAAAVLTDITKKSALNRVQWTPAFHSAFAQLQKILCSAPVLRSPDLSCRYSYFKLTLPTAE